MYRAKDICVVVLLTVSGSHQVQADFQTKFGDLLPKIMKGGITRLW